MVKISLAEFDSIPDPSSLSIIMEYAFGNENIDFNEVQRCAKEVLEDGQDKNF
jgi:hypothetical protein